MLRMHVLGYGVLDSCFDSFTHVPVSPLTVRANWMRPIASTTRCLAAWKIKMLETLQPTSEQTNPTNIRKNSMRGRAGNKTHTSGKTLRASSAASSEDYPMATANAASAASSAQWSPSSEDCHGTAAMNEANTEPKTVLANMFPLR